MRVPKLELSRNTIKSYCHTLAEEGCLEGVKGSELNLSEGLKIYNGNKIYYKRCQRGIKKPLIRCQISELKKFLEEKTKKPIDTLEFDDFDELSEDSLRNDQKKGIKFRGRYA